MTRLFLVVLILALQGCAVPQFPSDWAPWQASAHVVSLESKRGGLHLVEPYDPERIPVLFIHGAGGQPQDWRYFIEHLDRSRFQAWVYHYPTVAPIDVSAGWLDEFVAELNVRYRPRRLIVVAHSMGGLVARRFIARNAQAADRPRVDTLVTFSTPWGGVPIAKLGAALGRFAIPSWKDLVPDSEFLREMQAESLPASLSHHLFFAYLERGDELDSDGIVSVASQLEPHVGTTARVYALRNNHSAVLEDPSAFGRFAGILAAIN